MVTLAGGITWSALVLFYVSGVRATTDQRECIPLSECQPYLWLLRNKDSVPSTSTDQVLQFLKEQHCGFGGKDPQVNCPSRATLVEDVEGDVADQRTTTSSSVQFFDPDETTTTTRGDLETDVSEISHIRDVPVIFSDEDTIEANDTAGESQAPIRFESATDASIEGSKDVSGDQGDIKDKDSNATGSYVQAPQTPAIMGGRNALIDNSDYRTFATCTGSLIFTHATVFTETEVDGPQLDLAQLAQLRLAGQEYRNLRKHLIDQTVIHIESYGNCCYNIYSRPNFRGKPQFLPLGFSSKPNHQPASLQETPCLKQ